MPIAGTARPLDEHHLTELATRLARARRLWEPHVVHRSDGRRPVKLVATDLFEAWVIGWMPGQGVELHDHGDSAGALSVIEGTLVDLVAIDRRLRPRSLTAGTTLHLPPGTVHDVVAPGPEPATSIHVYSPPLTSMTFYDGPGGAAVRSSLVVPGARGAHATEVARALHPSTGASGSEPESNGRPSCSARCAAGSTGSSPRTSPRRSRAGALVVDIRPDAGPG